MKSLRALIGLRPALTPDEAARLVRELEHERRRAAVERQQQRAAQERQASEAEAAAAAAERIAEDARAIRESCERMGFWFPRQAAPRGLSGRATWGEKIREAIRVGWDAAKRS